MKTAVFDIVLEGQPSIDTEQYRIAILSGFKQVRESMLESAKGVNREATDPTLAAFQASARIQVMVEGSSKGVRVEISAEDLAVLYGGAVSALTMMLLAALRPLLMTGGKAVVDEDSPGIQLIEELHRAKGHAGGVQEKEAPKRGFIRPTFVLYGILIVLFSLPVLGVWHLKNMAEAKLEEMTAVASDLKALVEEQGKKLEDLYEAGAKMVNWNDMKDKVSDLWGQDSSEVVK